jgi:hypothetical protein
MSYDEWLIQPIFVYKLNPTDDNKSNNCIITYGFKIGQNNAILLATAFYSEAYKVEYDHNGKPVTDVLLG